MCNLFISFCFPLTLFLVTLLYWHLWFHEVALTSMEPFHCTKASVERGSLDYRESGQN